MAVSILFGFPLSAHHPDNSQNSGIMMRPSGVRLSTASIRDPEAVGTTVPRQSTDCIRSVVLRSNQVVNAGPLV